MRRVNACLRLFERKWTDDILHKILQHTRGMYIGTTECIFENDLLITRYSRHNGVTWILGLKCTEDYIFGWETDGIFYGFIGDRAVIGDAVITIHTGTKSTFTKSEIKIAVADMSRDQLLFGISQMGFKLLRYLIRWSFYDVLHIGVSEHDDKTQIELNAPFYHHELPVHSSIMRNIRIAPMMSKCTVLAIDNLCADLWPFPGRDFDELNTIIDELLAMMI